MFNFFRGNRGQRSSEDRGRGRGISGGTKPGSGPGGSCVCPKCSHKVKHQIGQRCMDLPCPKCGTTMIKE